MERAEPETPKQRIGDRTGIRPPGLDLSRAPRRALSEANPKSVKSLMPTTPKDGSSDKREDLVTKTLDGLHNKSN